MNVYITVDTEVWPVHRGGWPLTPLPRDYLCERELSAYFLGRTQRADYGLPYQLDMLRNHGLKATYFVDPLFSFALGLGALRQVVEMIQSAGQRIALHLHPEWLTDPRCAGLPAFRGPYISQYSFHEQRTLIRVGLHRLREAGAQPEAVFRAGSWGADVTTLQALQAEGIRVDSSLNAAFSESMPSLPMRSDLQEPTDLNGVTEFPVTRFDDHVSRLGRPLSVIGASWSEMRYTLDSCLAAGRSSVVLVMHSNEFVKTERLWKGQCVVPRRMAIRRFEKLCDYLNDNRTRLTCLHLPDQHGLGRISGAVSSLPKSSIARTALRMVSQAASRWY